MDVKFTVVSKALLEDVEQSDGQIIVLYDEPGMYYMMNGRRYAVLGMQYKEVFQKPTLESIPDANSGTFYFYNSTSEDGGLYLFNATSRIFVRVSHPTGLTVKVSSLGTNAKMYLTGATSYNPSNPVSEQGSSSVYVQNTNGESRLFAPKFNGDLIGTATKAQKDINNNDITSYVRTVQAVSGTDQIQFIDGNGNVLVTITTSEINIYKVTIPSNGWTAISGGSGYTQDVVTSSTMTVNSTIISVLPATNSTAAQKAAFEQWDSIETGAGKITITAPTQISTNFDIVIIETPRS